MKPLNVDDVRIEDPDFYFEGRRESYERLHSECPVFYYEPLDVFVLTKHEDIKEAARTTEIFSSAPPPRPRELRGVATRNFAPRPLARLGEQVRRDVTELTSKIEPGTP